MTISELIRRLENTKFRNPNAEVRILEVNEFDVMRPSGAIRFGEMIDGALVNMDIDPLENDMRPLQTLVIYGPETASKI